MQAPRKTFLSYNLQVNNCRELDKSKKYRNEDVKVATDWGTFRKKFKLSVFPIEIFKHPVEQPAISYTSYALSY